MGMGNLSTFEPSSQIQGDRLSAKDTADDSHALLVNVVDTKHGIKTKYSPEGGSAVYVDILDLNTQDVFIHVMWMNNVVYDNLASHVGETVPIRLAWKNNAAGTDKYISVQSLTDEEIAVAQQWVDSRPNLFDDKRREREIPTGEQLRSGQTSVAKADGPVAAMGQSANAATPPPAPPVATAQPTAAATPPPAAAVSSPPPPPPAAPAQANTATPPAAPAADDDIPF